MDRTDKLQHKAVKESSSGMNFDNSTDQLNSILLDNVTDSILLFDFAGNILYANETWCRVYGYTRDKLTKLNLFKQVVDHESHLLDDHFAELREKGQASFESLDLRKDGSRVPVEVNVRTIEIDDQKLLLSVVRDITERKKAEEELKLKEEILDKSSDSIIIRDADAKIVYANETAYKSRGYTKDEFLNMTIYQLLVPGQVGLVQARTKDMLKPGTDIFESIHAHKNGTKINVEVHRAIIKFGEDIFSVTITRDITERKRTESDLRLKEQILDQASDAIILRDLNGKIVYANEEAYRARDYSRDEFIGKNLFELLPPQRARESEQKMHETIQRGNITFESTYTRRDHTLVPAEFHMNSIEIGGDTFVLSVIRDLTERKKAKNELRLKEQILDSATDSILLREPEGKIVYANEIAYTSHGYSRDEFIGMNIQQLLTYDETRLFAKRERDNDEQGTITFESTHVCKDGSLMPVEVKSSQIMSDNKLFYLAVIRDITQRKQMEEYIRQLAYYDALTGLPNRTLFNDRFVLAQEHAARYQHMLAVMVMDLDNFKNVNDSLGHEAGDCLLKEVASRLVNSVRRVDTVSRMGGDEFVLLLPEMLKEANDHIIVERLVEAFKQPFAIKGNEIFITFSMGIALFPLDGKDMDALVRKADIAMYQVKKKGRNGFLHYTLEMGITEPV